MNSQTFQKLLNAAGLSIAICTILSVFDYIYNQGLIPNDDQQAFHLVNPFGVTSNSALYQLFVLLIYAAVGIFFWTSAQLFKNGHAGLKKANLIHLIASFLGFSLLGVLTSFPFGMPLRYLKEWYGPSEHSMLYSLLIYPFVFTLFSYLIVWLAFWLYYRRQIKRLNKKLGH